MSKPKTRVPLPRTNQESIDATIARVRRLQGLPEPETTFDKLMVKILTEDNQALVAEVERLRQLVHDLRTQHRIENIAELERQFPRKGRRKSR
jgi:hypothetical protein